MIAVIVLGNRLRSIQIHPELKGRVEVGIGIFKDKFAEYLILSGGKTNPSIPLSESEVMRDYAIMLGVSSEVIIIEQNSMDTIGNAYFTRKIIDELGCSDIYVVTSCYHVNRAKFIFEMCYGKDYNMFFSYCFSFHDPEAEKKEIDSIRLAEEFFKDIMPGDLNEIEKKLFSIHTLYKNNWCNFA
jgi:uncharacterized SAM-binding protein YcdF (DUF218 family)